MKNHTNMNRGHNAAPTNKKSANTGFSISRRSGTSYALPRAKVVPPGVYSSIVQKVSSSTTRAGDDAVDFCYDLTDTNGKVYHVLQRYPFESTACDDLSNRLIDAGLPEGSDFADAVGLKETVAVVYRDGSTIGSIVATSEAPEVSSDEEPEDDFDTFLEDEEDDEEDGP